MDGQKGDPLGCLFRGDGGSGEPPSVVSRRPRTRAFLMFSEGVSRIGAPDLFLARARASSGFDSPSCNRYQPPFLREKLCLVFCRAVGGASLLVREEVLGWAVVISALVAEPSVFGSGSF